MKIKRFISGLKDNIAGRSYTQKVGAAGFLLGLIVFFNNTNFIGFALHTVFSGLAGTIVGYSVERFGRKGWIALPAIILVSIFIWQQFFSTCLMYLPHYFPQEHAVTGEVERGPWDGFRVQYCDKDKLPWYYVDLNQERKSNLCNTEKWNITYYCIDPDDSPEKVQPMPSSNSIET